MVAWCHSGAMTNAPAFRRKVASDWPKEPQPYLRCLWEDILDGKAAWGHPSVRVWGVGNRVGPAKLKAKRRQEPKESGEDKGIKPILNSK